jgi:hypothetical protein
MITDFNSTLKELQATYELNKCFVNETRQMEIKTCGEFQLVRNQTGLKYTDSELNAYKFYDYKLCARNSHAVTCAKEFYSRQTQATQPADFVHFDYRIDCGESVTLSWSYPLWLNGLFRYFKLYRDGVEIHRSLNLSYTDSDGLKSYELYKYELDACNHAGCVRNEKTLLVSTANHEPEMFGLIGVHMTHESISLSWRLPLKPHGALTKFILEIREICLELPVFFDFSVNSTKLNLSQQDLKEINRYSII